LNAAAVPPERAERPPVVGALTGGGDSGTPEVAEDEHASVADSWVDATELQLPDLDRVGAPARSGD
jgi:hypothetical protein